MGVLAVFYYKPEGFIAGLIVFVGAYSLTHSLQGLKLEIARAICEFLLILLTPAIHLATLAKAPASFTGLVFTFLLPGVAQAYWIGDLWPATGALVHLLPRMCAAWLTLLGGRIFAQKIFVDAARSNRAETSPTLIEIDVSKVACGQRAETYG